ncbi:MAG: ABC-F family ATP-binding cassette domain-containing protein, partial [Bacteroidota bacterium]
MNYLSLENVSKTYGDKVLFKNLDLQISMGDKVALVAKNGTGKTTLLKVIAGIEAGEGETCKIQVRKGIRIGFLEQEPVFLPGQTITDAVFDSDHEMIRVTKRYAASLLHPADEKEMEQALAQMDDLKAWDFEARMKEILFKLKIERLDQQVSTLSGGQKKRLALAKLLIEDPEFLILDEPTNHLDLDMIEWLENYLQQAKLTVFMVTHDRYFLERVCNTIVELDRGILYKYRGSYSDFLEKKSMRQENESTVLDKTKKLMRKELEWIRRQPKARGTKAKSRVDKFFEIKEKAGQKLDNDRMQIDIKGSRLGSKIIEAHNISKSFDDFKIVENFSYKFKKKERVGIVGPNGVGKTTFLKLLTKSIRPDHGKVIVGDTVVFGYYTQAGIQGAEDKKVIDVVRDVAEYIPLEKGQKLTAINLLDRFLFSREQHQVQVAQLSGGERRRLYLLTVLMENPNFLILDEPTNDLDILTLNILEEFLMDFPGCLIVVSHDRYFMDKLVDHLFILEGKGRVKDYNGNYSDYRTIAKARELEERRQ